METYHVPTELERAFLGVMVHGYPELERQIESCLISDYDLVGFCYVNVLVGPPSPELSMANGPQLDLCQIDKRVIEFMPHVSMADPQVLFIHTSLSTDDAGMLSAIEVVTVGDGYVANPYRLFVLASESNSPALMYPDVHGLPR